MHACPSHIMHINQWKPHSPAWWVLRVPTFAQGKTKPKNLRDCRPLSLRVGLLCLDRAWGHRNLNAEGLCATVRPGPAVDGHCLLPDP